MATPSNMSDPFFRSVLDSLNREVLNALDLTKAIKHPGEGGHARENVIAQFFRRLLPDAFGLSTGFVIDATGKISKQIDLIVYRNTYHPTFEIGGIKHFPVESVCIVMENKASIKSKDTLREALENIRSVKNLDRSNRGRNYTINGSQRSANVDLDNFNDQIFGVIITEELLSKNTLKNELLRFVRNNPPREWPNVYADIRNFTASYCVSIEPAEATVIPARARFLIITDKSYEGFVFPLVELAFEVVNFLRVSSLIDYSPRDYLVQQSGRISHWKI